MVVICIYDIVIYFSLFLSAQRCFGALSAQVQKYHIISHQLASWVIMHLPQYDVLTYDL